MTHTAPKVGFVSLGCPKNLVDSELILTQLRADGYEIVSSYDQAQVVVVNTCGFTEQAIAESLQVIDEALQANGQVVVTGCLGKNAELIRHAHPRVLGVTGPQAIDQVRELVHRAAPPQFDPFTSLVPSTGIKLTPPHYAYVKISEGCNHHCSFCIIPSMRGKLVSRPIDTVLTEVDGLVAAGVKEIAIISQDTSAYGVDLKYPAGFWRGKPVRTRFADLVRCLAQFPVWIRLHYVYPYPHIDEIIPFMAQGAILPYLDVPLQHASATVLKRMRRPADSENMLARIDRWREICPELSIRSTFIVGFPGETDEDFQQLLAFLRAARLNRVGCFTYSPVQGAAANTLDGAVPEQLKQQRMEELMIVQAEISAAKLRQKKGHTLTVLVDAIEDGEVIGRSYADAPEIDGLVVAPLPEGGVQVGDFVQVQIEYADEHDLFGRINRVID